MSSVPDRMTSVWRRRRAAAKRRYSSQLAIGLSLLFIAFFTFFYIGSVGELWKQTSLLVNIQLTEARFLTANESLYVQPGTDVRFRRWDTVFEFTVGDQQYQGSEVVDYPPLSAKTAIVYFDKTNPTNHSIRKPSFLFLLFNAGSVCLPFLISFFVLLLAWFSKRRLDDLESEKFQET